LQGRLDCIQELFEEQAARRPEAVALRFQGGSMSYAELDARSEGLAEALRRMGVGADVLVGVCLERSPEAVVAILAVLKAGGAYAPLDPSYPAERLALLLEDAGAPVLLTRRGLLGRLPETRARVICLDGDLPRSVPPAGPRPRAWPESLAYVMYTSGSTGRPKGVAVTHRNVVRLVRETDFARFGPDEVFLLLAPLSFDASTLELWGPLLNGGTLVVFPPHTPALEELGKELVRQGITTLWLTAGLFHPMVESQVASLRGLRQLLAGGDVLSPPQVLRVLRELPGLTLINGYGPTENTTFTCCHRMRSPEGIGASVPIGRPIANTRVCLLDRSLRPVPPGVAGELCAGGDGLARGYVGRPDLTAERFIPDPLGGEGQRLYRTGDLARLRATGEIELLGRIDQQVKIRGFRIEPGEIEAALCSHPAVSEAAVVVRGQGDDKRLVACLVASSGVEAEMRTFLRERLPEHMIPAAFVVLDALPLTLNGKVDRQALARIELPRDSAAGDVTAPRNPTEELLAGIWEEVLRRDRVGIDESFLDLGGDSLLAARIQARVEVALELDLHPSAVLEASTVAALAEQVERALAERALTGCPWRRMPILPRPRNPGGEPLSSAQRRLWFVERLVPGTPANNIPVVMRLEGPLTPAVLGRCLAEITARHQALRTRIELGPDGEPLQLVAPPSPVRLPLVDLAGLPHDRRLAERERLARAEACHPLDPGDPGHPGGGALWRLSLVRVGETEHDLLVTLHHVIADGASIVVFERELAALYPAFLHGRPSPLPPPTVQPADIAAWEHDGLSAEALAPHAAWFREHLAGAPGGLDLPADQARPPARSWRGVSQVLDLPPSISREVRDFARRRGATRYMVLLAAWVALLRRITGQDDFVVGTVFAHRGRSELEGMIGYFANTLPLRVEHPGDPAFGDLLTTVRARALGVFAHQDLPLETLAEVLRPQRASSADPLFQVFFAYRGNAGPRELAPGLTLTWREEDHGAAQFDLCLDLEEKGEEIAGRLVAGADLFTAATAGRLARGWMALLAGALARPEAPLSTLALLGAAESHALLVEWSRSPGPPAWDGSVPARIAARAAATPEAIAVEPADPGRPGLTYGELVGRARRLAGHLRSRGAGLDVRIGVYAERSPETVVGLLAVLLAGGAFLPLDPAHPPERLAATLEDARVPLLLARSALAATLPLGGAELVPLDAEIATAREEPLDEIGPEDLAYVIYTSGSTGRPKGVLIQHRGFLWAVEALAERSGVEPGSRVLQFASASFDASVWEIWSTLVRGATLVFARAEDLLPGEALLTTLQRRGITNVFLTPSALAALPEGASRELSGLRGLVVGGEAFPPGLVTRWAAGRRLWNAYGPTEGSICVSMARLGEDGQVPIGRPVADSRLLVLGPHGELLPRGAPGELHLGGRGLARGYLGRPDLTARAFVPDPTGEEPGGRLYRTGDLVRVRPDGQLEFLGRADRQVKVRGFRIEPGEIEAQIVEHPGVREAAVVPYEAVPGDLRLAAYVAGGGPAAPTVQELRAFLRSRLPEHMIPSFFAFLPALPLTPGGKIDRSALPPPGAEAEPAPAAGPAVPGTPAEELLAGIWGEVLGRTEMGAGDDFFDLGGHSLLVGQVLARVRTAFGVDLPVRAAFEARTLAALARCIEEARLTAAGTPAPAPLVRVPRDRPLPLSFGQERLWFLQRLDPGSTVYNLPLAFRLTGSLDAAALERSLDEVFRRHEVLRTTFAEGPDGEPCQIVAAFQAAGLPRIDLSGLPSAVASAEADRQIAREARRPFDLVRGPVARSLLLRLGEQEHLLVFSCHHAAFDGWSVGVLRRELGALYGAFHAGRPSPLSELAVQYADHAAWQRHRFSGNALEAQLAWWRQRLAGAPAALELPADRLRPPAQSFRGATLPLAFPAGLAAGLRGLARSEGSTLFMTALAAFSALLARLTGQTGLVVGSPVANRTEAGSEDLLGFFVNTLALRADLADDPPFHALAARVRESALAAYAHQDLPFERLVEALQPARDLSRSPLFQVMLSLDPLQDGALAPGLGCELLRIDGGTAKFDLTVFLNDQGTSLTALLEYATDLFDAPTVARLGCSFLALLSGLVTEGGAGMPVSRLPLLGEGESWQIRAEWHEPGQPASQEECLHHLVATQAARTPEATALVAGRERITYRDLERRAGALARRLAALGVGPEVRVGVCLSRTPALVVSLLGILQAGGAYVPLDPNYPRERLGFMLEDADAAVLITETALAERLPASRARVLLLDSPEEDRPAGTEPARESTRALPGNLAYLIYTSGSTGRPKAVAIEHRSAVAFVHWALAVFTREELAAVLASTSISFDLSVFELFVPLACGGQIVLAGTVLELPELPAAGEVTLINSVPSAVSALLELERALPAGVRTVNLAGEPLKGSLAQALYAAGAARVRNLYGPSEDTTYSTFETVKRGSRREPTIGRPITGTWARLLDRSLELAPVGVPGEIYLGGAGLARGYLGRPELTAERFVPDPLDVGTRLYRTGDLGRLLPDGRIEYLGRLDNQVKVRGFRIELGEIETALEAHPQVREAVVVARGEPGGDRFLAAYVVPAGPPALTSAELCDHLRVRLAEFMVPSSFTLLDAMPLTPNGKVDRKALPVPMNGPAEPAARPGGGPAAPLVELLAGIWAEVLGRPELPGPHDNFFELGGHSLLATRVVSRVRAALGIEVPLRTLFAAPTLSALAVAIAALTTSPPDPIATTADRESLPLSFAQQRLWLLDRLEPGSPVYNLPFPRQIRGPLAPAFLERALREVERRHEVLRTTFAVDVATGEPRLTVAPPGGFSLPQVDLTALPPPAREAEARRLADEDAGSPFDLAAGPLFRARLLTLDAEDHHLLMTVHHVAGDGWSLDLLLNELSALYPACAAKRPSPLPEPAVQYADFAAWQRRRLDGPILAGQLAYWRRQLAGAPAVLDLPADRPRPETGTSRGAHFLTVLPAELTAAVRTLSRRQGATLFMVLCAGFAALLEQITGAADFLLGSPVAGRGSTEIEGLIGFFVNTLVLRMDLSGAPSFATLIARVREVALGAYAHQDVPFERLVEELQPERDLARSPLFQVSFVLGVEETAGTLAPGLPHTPLPVENHTSKFDLTLGLDLRGDTLVADVEFRTDLFDRATVERWAGGFTHLLRKLAAHPDVPLAEIAPLSGIEDLRGTARAERPRLRGEVAEEDSPAPSRQAPPRSPLEELVAGLWAEALGRVTIGLHDHFFALGGYSLLAIRVLARLRAATGVDLPLRAIFANPTVATLAAEIESHLRAPAPGTLPPPPIEPAGVGSDAPAAAAQERLWYFHQLDRSRSVLNVPHPLRLSGPLRPAALARSLSEIARRHAPLRTTFANSPEGLRQRIAVHTLHADLALLLVDLSGLPPARREEEARRVTEAEAREPFDLAAGPLWRTRLLRLETGEHRLLLTFHHAVVDGWSIDLLERELALLYPAFSRELPSPLTEPALQYADFAVWQRRQLDDGRLAPQLAIQLEYWRRQLAGAPAVLDLPTDRPRPARPTFRGAARYLPLPQEVAAQTKELGRREGSTLFMTALAAFAALVSRITGRTDVVLGSPAANRHTPGTEDLFGFFVGVLPFRLDLGGDPTFRELLRRARETALGAYAHPDVPFERLVEELDLARDKSRTPLVQVMLSVRNGSGEPLRWDHVTAEPVEVHSATSQFDFTLGVVDLPHGLTLEAEYSTDLFDGSTVERLLDHLARLLGAAVADPEIRLSALPAAARPQPETAAAPPSRETSMPNPDPKDRSARLAARRAGLSPEERALLEQRLRARGGPKAEAPPPASASLVPLQPSGSRPPFFCVHPAGGDVLCFQALSRHMGPDQPFYGLQSRGLGPDEVPFTSIEEMAARYRAEITAASPGPYHLGGWSLGGAVAFEVARQLVAAGREVALLAVIDSTPGAGGAMVEDEEDADDTPWLLEIADYLERLWGLDLGLSAEVLRGLSPEDQALRLLAGLQHTPFGAKAGPESLRRLLAVFKTNVRAFRRYRPSPYPGKITFFLPAEAAGKPEEDAGLLRAWGELSPQPVDVETVPGDHVSALAEPHVQALAARLRHRIAAKETRPT